MQLQRVTNKPPSETGAVVVWMSPEGPYSISLILSVSLRGSKLVSAFLKHLVDLLNHGLSLHCTLGKHSCVLQQGSGIPPWLLFTPGFVLVCVCGNFVKAPRFRAIIVTPAITPPPD